MRHHHRQPDPWYIKQLIRHIRRSQIRKWQPAPEDPDIRAGGIRHRAQANKTSSQSHGATATTA
jgi:hypothetical protein